MEYVVGIFGGVVLVAAAYGSWRLYQFFKGGG